VTTPPTTVQVVPYPEIRAAVHARLKQIPGILLVTPNEPRVLTISPTIYTLFAGLTRHVEGQQEKLTYRMIHRLCIKWVENERAEEQLAELVNPVLRGLTYDPQLSGLIGGGMVSVTTVEAGYMALGENQGILTHRIVDFTQEVLTKGPAPQRHIPGQP
jgi:hypothetical protein